VTAEAAVRPLSGWGRYPVRECAVQEPSTVDDAARPTTSPAIARGQGRSYGDASLGVPGTLVTTRLDRLLAFDPATGVLTCEAGTTLADIVSLFAPRGWFPPVTPGTKFVTVGGMIAADVHGKNHHGAGSFCDHVLFVDLALGDGTVLRCSRTEHPDLFAATCGGMGLTGVILAASFALIPIESCWIRQTVERAPNLDAAMALFERSQHWTYSVAWIDGLGAGANLGRSVVFLGEHALAAEAPAPSRARKPLPVPVDLPAFALNRLSVGLFNHLYYRRQGPRTGLAALDTYFYPLDGLSGWNRLYGRAGFVQYQCVLPLAASRSGLAALLELAAREGTPSFLAVLKRMGRESFGHLSFPLDGYTLALDFPASPDTFALLDKFDAIVAAHGGRIYLAKDARTSARMIEAGYPRLDAFRELRRRYGLDQRFRSALSGRLGL
jgi:decaprenylphospho-beta-D-ribofuranose 2-oxidase